MPIVSASTQTFKKASLEERYITSLFSSIFLLLLRILPCITTIPSWTSIAFTIVTLLCILCKHFLLSLQLLICFPNCISSIRYLIIQVYNWTRYIWLCSHRFPQHSCHIIDHFISHTWIHSNPESTFHNQICRFQRTAFPIVSLHFPHFIKAWLLNQITGKQHSCLHAMWFQVLYYMILINTIFTCYQKTKPW